MSATSKPQDEQKRAAALAAMDRVRPSLDLDAVIGVGTGSTVNFFIDALADAKHLFRAAVSSSTASTERLRGHGIDVIDLNDVNELPVYVDGADEATSNFHLIKGGGGALTREKIVAEVAAQFICIVDRSKRVDVLGAFPLPVEVIPMAQALVGRRLAALGGRPQLRTGFTTDNGNVILDVHGLRITNPRELEESLNQIPGVVCNGLFARRGADVLLTASEDGVETLL